MNVQEKFTVAVAHVLSNTVFPHLVNWLHSTKGVNVTVQELMEACELPSSTPTLPTAPPASNFVAPALPSVEVTTAAPPTTKARAAARSTKYPVDAKKQCKHQYTKGEKANTTCGSPCHVGYDYCPSCLRLVSTQNKLNELGIALPENIEPASTKGKKATTTKATTSGVSSILPPPGMVGQSNGLPQQDALEPAPAQTGGDEELDAVEIKHEGIDAYQVTISGITFITERDQGGLGPFLGVMDGGKKFRSTFTTVEKNIINGYGFTIKETTMRTTSTIIESTLDLPTLPNV